jgi:aryl-alcohol dehydrogenase-like predicted oxidoreductase
MTARLGLGTATFIPGYGPTTGGRPGAAILTAAFAAGVRYVDTAAAYGESEAALGEVADTVRTLDVRIATKLRPTVSTPLACREAMDASLRRLGLAAVDTVLLHSATAAEICSEATAGAWRSLRKDGLARRVGASTYGPDAARLALSSGWCDAVQVEFSILNQEVMRALAPLRVQGVEIITRSVLCKGLLTPSGSALTLPAPARETLQQLGTFAREMEIDLTTLAIRFALDTPGIDVVLVGVSDRGELDTAVRAAGRRPLTVQEYQAVAAFDRSDAEWSHPERWREGTPV